MFSRYHIHVSFSFQPSRGPGKKYRSYSLEDLTKAYRLVTEKKLTVKRVADEFCIPESTLRDRVKGKVPLTTKRSGPAPVLGFHEEEKLVEYLKTMSSFGYGFSRTDIINFASDYAVLLGKRAPTDAFTHQWYYNFLNRWPNQDVRRASGTKRHYEKAMSIDCLSQYFFNLQNLMTKHDLMSKPDSIFMLDEILIDIDRSPPSVYSWRENMRFEKYKKLLPPTMTLIASGNASGARLPAFFIFKGKTVTSESIEDCSPGTGATCSDDGLTNGNVFQLYLENHFLKFIERQDDAEAILLLYDGHRSHVSPTLVELYKTQNVHLFPIPPSASQMLINVDRGIFGDFERNFTDESEDFLETEMEKSVHSNVCVIASKAYNSSVVEEGLKEAFQKCGVYPFKPQQVHKNLDIASTVPSTSSTSCVKKEKMIVVKRERRPRRQTRRKQTLKPNVTESDDLDDIEAEVMVGKSRRRSRKRTNYSNRRKSAVTPRKRKRLQPVNIVTEKPSLKLKLVRDTSAPSGSRKRKAKQIVREESEVESSEVESETDSEIEEMLSSEEDETQDQNDDDVENKQREHFESALREELLNSHGLLFEGTQRERFEKEFERAKLEFEKAEAEKSDISLKQEITDNADVSEIQIDIQNDGSTCTELPNVKVEQVIYPEEVQEVNQIETGPTVVIESVEEEIPPSEKCCVCKQYHPEMAAVGYVVEFATWGKCDFEDCDHWTHLKYCCDIKVLRRHDKFYCPCHNQVSS